MTQSKYKPIPPTYSNGQAWSAKLLKSLNAVELKRLINLYGLNAINAQVAINAARAAGGQQ